MKKFSFVLLVLLLVLIMIPQASVAESFNAIQVKKTGETVTVKRSRLLQF